LYDLGLESESNFVSLHGPLHPTSLGTIEPISIPWPSLPPSSLRSKPFRKNPLPSLLTPLPLCITEAPVQITARAARVQTTDETKNLTKKAIAAEVVSHYLIGSRDMATIYISPDVYCGAFEEELNLQKVDINTHWMADLCFFKKDNCLILASIDLSMPGAQIPHWRNCIWGALLIKINGIPVSTIGDAHAVFRCLSNANAHSCTLLFLHSETVPDTSNKDLPIMSKSDFSQFTHDQLNNQLDLLENGLCILLTLNYDMIESGRVQNYVTHVMRLTCRNSLNKMIGPTGSNLNIFS
jgi:hypothetical protein